jgi:sialate O-acetylesterase
MRRLLCLLGIVLFVCLGIGSRSSSAEIRLPKMLSDHLVLQRQAPIHIWGWASPGERVTVKFHGQMRVGEADAYGEWSVWLEPEQAGGPYILTIAGIASADQPVSVSDVLVGDVWVASGQSNMEIPLRGFPNSAVIKNGSQEIAAATLPQVRLLRIDHKASDIPLDDISNTWTLCTPETAIDFSAVAYFFGRQINREEKVPIGLIDSTWGGTPVSSWISLDALGADSSFMPVFATRARFADQQNRLARVIAAEKREDAAALEAHRPLPKHHWHPEEISHTPAALYNGMIAPLTPYTIKGFLWYQGEEDSAPERSAMYHSLFSAMIADWRTQWRQGNLPFLYVQISSFRSEGENWGAVRDAQRRTLEVANSAMAVSIDVGESDNVHPADKQTVAARLAMAAHGMVYRDARSEYSGPLFRQATVESGAIRVWFDHATGGLRSNLAPEGSKVTPDSFQSAFEIAGRDHRFFPAKARIDGETVVVTSTSVAEPQYVRYAWDNDSTGGLYNAEGLPASTFTSE